MTAGQLGVSRLHAMAPKEFIDHVSKLYAFVTWENYLFGTETNQCFVFGTRKFELSYLASS